MIAYYLLLRMEAYLEIGGNYYDERDRYAVQYRLVRRLNNLGYQVTLTPAAALAA